MSPFLTYLGIFAFASYIVYILLRPKHKLSYTKDQNNQQLLTLFKENANKYNVDFDDCEFKDSSYVSEVEQDNTDYKLAGALVGSPIGFFHTPVERQENTQAVLFFKNNNIGSGKRFFQTFPMDMTTLKFHVLKGDVILWIDKNDKEKYYFELNG
jgi:hypothetical protein